MLYQSAKITSKGYHGKVDVYRVAVATEPGLVDLNGSSKQAREAIAAGKLAIENGVKRYQVADVVAKLGKVVTEGGE